MQSLKALLCEECKSLSPLLTEWLKVGKDDVDFRCFAQSWRERDSLGFKEKDSAFLGQSVKICIRGQFFVPNKTRRGTRLIF